MVIISMIKIINIYMYVYQVEIKLYVNGSMLMVSDVLISALLKIIVQSDKTFLDYGQMLHNGQMEHYLMLIKM